MRFFVIYQFSFWHNTVDIPRLLLKVSFWYECVRKLKQDNHLADSKVTCTCSSLVYYLKSTASGW